MKREICILLVLYDRNEMFSNYREYEVEKNLRKTSKLLTAFLQNISKTLKLRHTFAIVCGYTWNFFKVLINGCFVFFQ